MIVTVLLYAFAVFFAFWMLAFVVLAGYLLLMLGQGVWYAWFAMQGDDRRCDEIARKVDGFDKWVRR